MQTKIVKYCYLSKTSVFICPVRSKKKFNQIQGHVFEIFPITFKIEHTVYLLININYLNP